MGNDWVLAKTTAGVEEIAIRSRRIPARLRTVLILVDGRRSIAALAESATAFGDIHAALEALHDQGLVVLVNHGQHGADAASRASAAPAQHAASLSSRPIPQPQPLRRRSLALARLYLLDAMAQSLRHDDQPIRERLRAATSRADLLRAFDMCREIAGEVGVGHIDAIEEKFMEMLPQEG